MSSSPPTITKPPAERTFHAAVIVLCLAAAAQVIAAGLALVPRIDFDKWGRAMNARPAAAAPVVASKPTVLAPEDLEKITRANALLDQAQKLRAANKLKEALAATAEADKLAPNKPGIVYQLAENTAMLGDKPAAIILLKKIVALPPTGDPVDAGYVSEARSALAQLGVADVPAAEPPATAPVATNSAPPGEDVGIPIGSVMGIVEAKLLDAEPGQKNLRVSMKGASSQKIDPSKVHATVDFYEQDDHSQIMHNDVPRPSEWLSPPVDWAEGDPEIFQVKYRLPLEDRGDLAPLQYYGYVVAIYYNGELQDQRAEPPSLLNQYAPPLHKDPPSE